MGEFTSSLQSIQIWPDCGVNDVQFRALITGVSIGILVLGPTIDAIGVRWAFRMGSVLAMVTCLLYAIIHRFLPPVKLSRHHREEDGEKQTEEMKSLGTADKNEMTEKINQKEIDKL